MDWDSDLSTSLSHENRPSSSRTGMRETLGVCGLENLGNTCYMNASLQAMSNCPQITEFFLQCFDTLDKRKCLNLSSCYHDFVVRLWNSQNPGYIAPLVLLRKIQFLFPAFRGFGQHDAQEFLRVFLNQLNDEMTLPSPAVPLSIGGQPAQEPDKKSGSIVTDVFQGKLTSAVRCLSCRKISTRKEIFLDISLSLQRTNMDGSSLAGDDLQPVSGGTTSCVHPGASLLNRSPTATVAANALASVERHPFRSTALSPPTKNLNPVTAATKAKRIDGGGKRATPPHTKSTRIPVSNCEAGEPGQNHPSTALGRRQSCRDVRRTLVYPVLAVGYSVPLVKRFLFYIVSLVSLSITWIFNRMWDVKSWISLPNITMDDCLSDYFSHAELSGENRYYCDWCKKLCDGLNQYSILSLPEVLCIHLKRFRSNYNDTSKVYSRVSFPLHGLDLRPYLHRDCSDTVTTYNLMSIICHRGGYGGGHYVAYALNRYTQTWYEFDDDRVSEVTPDQVEQMTKDVYVLFYRKCDDRLIPLRDHVKMQVHQFLHSANRSDCVYISRSWFVRFSTWAEPGPVNNASYLCQHERVAPQLCADWQECFFPIPKTLGEQLVDKFGGGPLIHNALPCPVCLEAIRDRQKREYAQFEQFVGQCKPLLKYYAIYAVSSTWLNSWKDFVLGKTWVAPGPIDNTVLVDYHSPRRYFGASSMFASPSAHLNSVPSSGQPPLRLKIDADYQNLVEPCWKYLHGIYGGQPELCIHREIAEPPTLADNYLVDLDVVNAEEMQQPIEASEAKVSVSVHADPAVCAVGQLVGVHLQSLYSDATITSSGPSVGDISNDLTFSPSTYHHNEFECNNVGSVGNHVADLSLDSSLAVSSGGEVFPALTPEVSSLPMPGCAATSQHALHNGLSFDSRPSAVYPLHPDVKPVPGASHRKVDYVNGSASLQASGDNQSSLITPTFSTLPLLSDNGDAIDCSSDSCYDDGDGACPHTDSQQLLQQPHPTHCHKQHQQTYPCNGVCADSDCFGNSSQDECIGNSAATTVSCVPNGGTPQLRKRPHLLSNS